MAHRAASDIFQKSMDSAIDSMSVSREIVSRYLVDDDQSRAMEVLENLMRSYCELNDNFEVALKTTEAVVAELNQGKRLRESDIDNLYNHYLNEINPPKSSIEDIEDHPLWKEVFGNSNEVLEVQANKAAAPVAQEYERVGGEDSIMCSNAFTPPVDPFSKKVIRNPYRNRVCNHVYEYDTIADYIKQSRHRAKCPYVGCSNRRFRQSDLVKDDDLASQITDYLSQNDSDDSS